MVVRMRSTRGHTRNRRAHHALLAVNFGVDQRSGGRHMRHRIDPKTGMYRGRQMMNTLAKIEKRQNKRAKKESAAAKK